MGQIWVFDPTQFALELAALMTDCTVHEVAELNKRIESAMFKGVGMPGFVDEMAEVMDGIVRRLQMGFVG